MLLVLNLPLIPLWVQLLKIPYRILFPLILLFCLIGSYSIKNSAFDMFVMIFSGIIGYLFRKFGYEAAPLILAFVLGPMLELNLRQTFLISKGSVLIFFTRPISAVTLTLSFLLLCTSFIPYLRRAKRLDEASGLRGKTDIHGPEVHQEGDVTTPSR